MDFLQAALVHVGVKLGRGDGGVAEMPALTLRRVQPKPSDRTEILEIPGHQRRMPQKCCRRDEDIRINEIGHEAR